MKIIIKNLTLCAFLAIISFADISCSNRLDQFRQYSISLNDLDPHKDEDREEYNNIKRCIVLNLTKERNNPSEYNVEGKLISPISLAQYVNTVVYKPETYKKNYNPETRCEIDRYERWTLAHIAAKKNDADLINILYHNDADMNVQLKTTILGELRHRASNERMYDCKEVLDNAPLHIALKNGSQKAAIALLNFDAKFDILNAANQTAYDLTTYGDTAHTIMHQKNPSVRTNNINIHARNLIKNSISRLVNRPTNED